MISRILVFWCLRQCYNQSKSRHEASDVGKTALETADMTKQFTTMPEQELIKI